MTKEILELQNIVKPLLEELRDRGVVRLSDEPFIRKVPVYKDNYWGRQVIDYYKDKKVSDFTPAKIIMDREEPSVSMQFNETSDGKHSEIKITAVAGRLNLTKFINGGGWNIPIEDGEIESTILEAIKNPSIKY